MNKIKQNKTAPRVVPSKHEKYMGLAMWMASFSKDPNTQVGAFIVSGDNYPLGWGYNGTPRSIDDDDVDWSRPLKYDFIVHAEDNAIQNAVESVYGSILYVTARPCKKCMLRIVSAGIKEVIYFPFNSVDEKSTLHIKTSESDIVDEIAELGSVELTKFEGNLNWMRDRIGFMSDLGIFS